MAKTGQNVNSKSIKIDQFQPPFPRVDFWGVQKDVPFGDSPADIPPVKGSAVVGKAAGCSGNLLSYDRRETQQTRCSNPLEAVTEQPRSPIGGRLRMISRRCVRLLSHVILCA